MTDMLKSKELCFRKKLSARLALHNLMYWPALTLDDITVRFLSAVGYYYSVASIHCKVGVKAQVPKNICVFLFLSSGTC